MNSKFKYVLTIPIVQEKMDTHSTTNYCKNSLFKDFWGHHLYLVYLQKLYF